MEDFVFHKPEAGTRDTESDFSLGSVFSPPGNRRSAAAACEESCTECDGSISNWPLSPTAS